jgi:hypothetical protein
VFFRLPRLAIVAALACSLGLHWGLFQSVAWMRMVISYSQAAPLTEALAKTFDGKHPCSLCKEIAKGKQSEKTSEFPIAGKKFEFSYSATVFVFTAPYHCWVTRWPEGSLASLGHTPPVPPPRLLPGWSLL